MKNMSFKNSQSGFTLVEIAIVLVIIGLLLGGVLKGTELIENAKVKRAVSEINGVTAAFYAYQDRYQRLPGDDGILATINARGGVWAAPFSGAGDNSGIINNTALGTTFNPTLEHLAFWQQLKAAGLISGNPADTGPAALPRNAFGGLIGLTTGAVGPAASSITGRIICSGSVPGKSAAAIDTQLDDGNGNTGKMRGIQGANNAAPSAALGPVVYSEAQTYTICTSM
jgi:prepilin-type N-terminal cleavage/methylation domain-containing protein